MMNIVEASNFKESADSVLWEWKKERTTLFLTCHWKAVNQVNWINQINEKFICQKSDSLFDSPQIDQIHL